MAATVSKVTAYQINFNQFIVQVLTPENYKQLFEHWRYKSEYNVLQFKYPFLYYKLLCSVNEDGFVD